MPTEPEFLPGETLRILGAHGVRYVLIGGLAAVAHGSPHATRDVDVTPERTPTNLRRLSAALDELGARVWTSDAVDGIPFGHDAMSLGAVGIWNLVTRFGRLDISFVPSGTHGYEDLHRDAARLEILGSEVEVAALADVIRSKEAADRPKDRLVLPVLRRLLEES
jgi:hypothetical protein